MSRVQQLITVTRCVKCHRHTLNGFLSLAGLQLVPLSRRPRSAIRSPIELRQYANINKPTVTSPESIDTEKGPILQGIASTEATKQAKAVQEESSKALEDLTAQEEEDLADEIDDDVESPRQLANETEVQEDASQAEQSEGAPWYLQEEEDINTETSLADRQRIPILPENSPEKLPAILEKLSTDIGLDYLTIIDLRGLDPPPALGAGVIMVIGTARSEKHLHVSGDRFARWLRHTYKLTPNADGLLGRNELKLKLRRKAKRARLLGSVGLMPNPDEDDGTKAGWICVDAGVIEHVPSVERSLDESGIIGFGGQTDGIKLVVQMMTEEKRREIDLETLWGQALKKFAFRKARAEAVETEDSLEEEVLAESSEQRTNLSSVCPQPEAESQSSSPH